MHVFYVMQLKSVSDLSCSVLLWGQFPMPPSHSKRNPLSQVNRLELCFLRIEEKVLCISKLCKFMRSLDSLQFLDMASLMATKEPKPWNVQGNGMHQTGEILYLTEKPFFFHCELKPEWSVHIPVLDMDNALPFQSLCLISSAALSFILILYPCFLICL